MVRTLEVNNGVLATQSIYNKLSGKMLTPLSCEEFALRISEGTDKEGTGRTLTAKDFTVLCFRLRPYVKQKRSWLQVCT